MKFKIIYFSSFFFFISLSLIANVNKKAVAACVGIDVNNHVALTGFRQSSTQENNVDFNTSSNCFGNVTSSQYAWFFTSAHGTAHIDIDIDAFMRGKIDIRQYLESIPRSRILQMQQALAKIQKSFTYNWNDDLGRNDAIDCIFDLVVSK